MLAERLIAALTPAHLLDRADPSCPSRPPLSLGAGLARALPDGGLPRGAVVELASPGGLARTTSVALLACAAAQAEARGLGLEGTSGAWCAWIDPSSTLHAIGVARAGVDMARLLVLRPDLDATARLSARLVRSGVFAVVVVDLIGAPGCSLEGERLDRWAKATRRLALEAEPAGVTVLLLTDLCAHRSMPLPVALRLELGRPSPEALSLRVAKDRHGRVGGPTLLDLEEALGRQGAGLRSAAPPLPLDKARLTAPKIA